MAIAAEVLSDNREKKAIIKLVDDIRHEVESRQSLTASINGLIATREKKRASLEDKKTQVDEIQEKIKEALYKEAVGEQPRKSSKKLRESLSELKQKISDIESVLLSIDGAISKAKHDRNVLSSNINHLYDRKELSLTRYLKSEFLKNHKEALFDLANLIELIRYEKTPGANNHEKVALDNFYYAFLNRNIPKPNVNAAVSRIRESLSS